MFGTHNAPLSRNPRSPGQNPPNQNGDRREVHPSSMILSYFSMTSSPPVQDFRALLPRGRCREASRRRPRAALRRRGAGEAEPGGRRGGRDQGSGSGRMPYGGVAASEAKAPGRCSVDADGWTAGRRGSRAACVSCSPAGGLGGRERQLDQGGHRGCQRRSCGP